MSTSDLYEALESIARQEFADITVRTELIRFQSGEIQKLRLHLTDEIFIEVHVSTTGRYSFHWERRLSGRDDIYRFDNAPHSRWQNISTYPHHFHDEREDNVVASPLMGQPAEGLRQVCQFARQKLRQEAQAKRQE
jgi:hypothetical protein